MADSQGMKAANLGYRKGKETDIAERIFALQRRNAASTKPREKAERTPQPSTSTPPRPASPRRLHAPPLPNPEIVVSHSSRSHIEADPEDFSRRLKISHTSPRPSHSKPHHPGGSPGKQLYDPNADLPRKHAYTAEPEATSDGASSSYASRGPPHARSSTHQPQQLRLAGDSHRQLFDHRKDDPVRFSVLARPQPTSPSMPHANGRPTPTPKSSGDWVSASSTSSAYAHSTISSNFTLSSATTGSSSASGLFDTGKADGRRSEDSGSGASAYSAKLKSLYRMISTLEAKILEEDKEKDEAGDRERVPGVLVKGRGGHGKEVKGGEDDTERWRRLIADHKELAEKMHNLLQMTLAPSVPVSLRSIPSKYNIPMRLWTTAFNRLLQSLRRASMPPTSSEIAHEHLEDFIYYAYIFYSGLLEEQNLDMFRSGWLEALGDLARYRMTMSAPTATRGAAGTLTVSNIATAAALLETPRSGTPNASALSDRPNVASQKAASPTPAARIDDSPSSSEMGDGKNADIPSVGIAAARLMELEPEKERWRHIAKEWYARGLVTTPGAGKLHHHLGLLSRDKDGGGEDLRGVYHFVKSMITIHPFTTSRESVLPLWSQTAQARRYAPDAQLTDQFVLLHGMLFTNIQLDDFHGVSERFSEKLQIEGGEVVEERDWIMMAVVNLGALLEYGRSSAALVQVAGIGGVSNPLANGRVRLMSKRAEADDKKMEVDDEDGEFADGSAHAGPSPAAAEAAAAEPEPEVPLALKLSMQLIFSVLEHALRKPKRRPSPYAPSKLNPYITIVLTFIATVIKDRHVLAVLERAIPWEAMATFLNSSTTLRRIVVRDLGKEKDMLLTSGCPPLPEDWCLRGLGWGGKKVYERGFWERETGKPAAEEHNLELDVLDRSEAGDQIVDGVIEDEGAEGQASEQDKEMVQRWTRIARAGMKIARYVDGFDYIPATGPDGKGRFEVRGTLAAKVARWKAEEVREREEHERRLRGTRWDDDMMDVDEDGMVEPEESDESEVNENDSPEVKELRERRRYLQSLLQASQWGVTPSSRARRARQAPRRAPAPQQLHVVAGYTILVVDTNILLSSLPMFATLVESGRWTMIVPLPVIMELEGLGSNASPLGEAATQAMSYITSHLRSHALSMKVQTSKGNYLSSLNVRTEQVDFDDEASWERNMDDLILRAALWQNEHWVDRSGLLSSDAARRDTTGAAKVVLISFDRMLRLKARSRELAAATEHDLAAILAPTT